MNEEAIIERLRAIFASSSPDIQVGIGDDAAIVSTTPQTAVTTDMAVDGVHFRKEWSTPEEIGARVAIANLADLYAMGATPSFLVVAVSLTGSESMEWIEAFAHGIADECRKAGATVIGGDIVRSDRFSVAITAMGRSERIIRKDGAHIGDQVYLSQLPGFSRAGLEQLERGFTYDQRAIDAFKRPDFDYPIARDYARATSMRDISDAFVIQAESMTQNYAFAIDPTLIEAAPDFPELDAIARALGFDVWELILGGGEDHVLLATGRDLPGIRIGEVVPGSGVTGLEKKKAPQPWRHF